VTAKILIGTPCYNGAVTIQYVSSLLRLQQMFVQKGIEFSLAMLGSESLITRARNFIVSQFLGRPQFTHLLFIDADIGFDPAFLGGLVDRLGLRNVSWLGLVRILGPVAVFALVLVGLLVIRLRHPEDRD